MFVRPPTQKKEKVHFVNNDEFRKELIRFKKKGYEGKIPDSIGIIVSTMADRMTKARCFAGYTFRQELIDDAMLTVFKYIDRFDTRRKNPFGYFTSVIYFSFLATIKKQNKLREQRLAHMREQIALFKDKMHEAYGSDRVVSRELSQLTGIIEELVS